MNYLILLAGGILALVVGSVSGYFARQSIAKKQAGTIEAKVQKKVDQAQKKSDLLVAESQKEANRILETANREANDRQREMFKAEQFLRDKERSIEDKSLSLKSKEDNFNQKVEELKKIKNSIEDLKKESLKQLEKISGLSKKQAKGEIIKAVESEYQKEILEKLKKLEKDGREKLEEKAKEILALVIQKYAASQSQEITTTTVSLPNDEIKGRIIGKEGRNIRTLERLTGVELIVDDTPEAVVISGFNPIRRQIAKIALEKLIQDGRIQPARIEETVALAKEEVDKMIEKAGETAIYDTGVVGLDPKLVSLLGRLRFRTSYGQNTLLHSIEVAHLAGALASEIGADAGIAKKAGLLHDIGKAVDHQVEGSHVEIGIKILEKFNVKKEIIDAMKSHHEDYPYESIEAVIIQTADAISGARPGARKDTLENYIQRLGKLEEVALSFKGVEKAWALQAGREIRVFVKPEEIDELKALSLAKEIAGRIQEELKYPGEIKVNVIRETRVIEYAK